MDLFEAIEKRHSYRGGFTDAPVSESDLRKIVDCGIRAPSGCNAQTTSFVIITDKKLITDISALLDKSFINTAQAIIACVVDHRDVYHGMSFGAEDCAASVENMLLAVTALGYATVWLDGCLRLDDHAAKIAAMLKVPENLEIRILLPIGVPAKEWDQVKRKPFDERAGFNTFPG